MHRQKKQTTVDPERTIRDTRLEILSLVKKRGLKISPNDFVLESFEDSEYPKMVRVAGKPNKVLVHSKEEESELTAKPRKPGRPPRSVSNGDSEDSSGSDK